MHRKLLHIFFHIITILFFGVACISTVHASVTLRRTGSTKIFPNASVTYGQILNYSFDTGSVINGAIHDQSGNGADGVVNGGGSVSGKIKQGWQLNGTGDTVQSGPILIPSGQSFSIHLFVRIDNLNSVNQSIVAIQDGTTPGSGYHYTPIGIVNGAFFAGFWQMSDIAGPSVVLHKWYALDLVYNADNQTQYFYVNGRLQGAVQDSSFGPPGSGYLLFGQREQSCSFTTYCDLYADYFAGALDDIRVYNRTLSAHDVKILADGVSTTINASQVASTIVTSGLVGYWNFDGLNFTSSLVKDVTGNGYDSTPENNPQPVIGKHGQGISFNGINQDIVSNSFPSVNNAFAISAWVKPTAYSQPSYAGAIGGTIMSEDEDGGFDGWILGLNSSGQLWFWPYNNGDKYSQAGVPLNKWSYVAVTYDGSAISFYINGVFDSSVPLSDVQSNPQLFKIGAESWITGYFQGSMDDVRLYDRSLSSSEVAQLYTSTR